MLIASLGEVISVSRLRGAQLMGSGSRDGVSAAMAEKSDAASSGLAARNCKNLRRLAARSSFGMVASPFIDGGIIAAESADRNVNRTQRGNVMGADINRPRLPALA